MLACTPRFQVRSTMEIPRVLSNGSYQTTPLFYKPQWVVHIDYPSNCFLRKLAQQMPMYQFLVPSTLKKPILKILVETLVWLPSNISSTSMESSSTLVVLIEAALCKISVKLTTHTLGTTPIFEVFTLKKPNCVLYCHQA